jgi:O-antigen/teichoic acid export membrane protein
MSKSTRAMTQYGRAFARAGSVYSIGMMAIVPIGLISVAVTTRYLSLSEYGRLATLFAAAATLSVISGLGVLQGMTVAAYGISESDDGGDDFVPTDPENAALLQTIDEDIRERTRVMGTGLIIVSIMSLVVCGAVALAASPVSGLFLGSPHFAGAVRLMALSAFTGAVWRVKHQVFRMERRAVMWSFLQWLRAVLVLVGTIAVLVAGFGVEGVLAATAAATALSTYVAILASRGLYRFAPTTEHVKRIWLAGKRYVLLSIAQVIQANISVLLLAIVASPALAGIFQIAQKIANVPQYISAGLLAGWAPLERSPVSIAAKDTKGASTYNAAIFTMFVVVNLFMLVLISLAAQSLIAIVAPAYTKAVPMIPILATAYFADAVFRGLYRASAFPRRVWWYTAFHLIWLVPYAIVVGVVVPVSPAYGAAVAQIAASGTISIGMAFLDRRGYEPRPFPWGRLIVGMALAAGFICGAFFLPVPSTARSTLAIVLALAFPAMLLRLGIISKHRVAVLVLISRHLWPRRMSRHELAKRLAEMPAREREVFVRVAWDRRAPEAVADTLQLPTPVVLARFTRAMRSFWAAPSHASPTDVGVAEYLGFRGTTLQRDEIAYRLRDHGVDPLDLDELDAAMGCARRSRRRGLRVLRQANLQY